MYSLQHCNHSHQSLFIPLYPLDLSRPCFHHYLVNHDRAFELSVVPVEALEQIDPVLHIVRPSCLANAVHGQNRVAQVKGSDTEFSGQHPTLIRFCCMQSGHQDELLTAR